MTPHLWPALMLVSFLAAIVTMRWGVPMGSVFDVFDLRWLVFEGCILAMVVFWALWVSGNKWDE